MNRSDRCLGDLDYHQQPNASELTTGRQNIQPTDFNHSIEQSCDNLAEFLSSTLNRIASGTSQVDRLSNDHLRYLPGMLKFMVRFDELEQFARDKALSPDQLKVLDQAKESIAPFTRLVNEIEKHR